MNTKFARSGLSHLFPRGKEIKSKLWKRSGVRPEVVIVAQEDDAAFMNDMNISWGNNHLLLDDIAQFTRNLPEMELLKHYQEQLAQFHFSMASNAHGMIHYCDDADEFEARRFDHVFNHVAKLHEYVTDVYCPGGEEPESPSLDGGDTHTENNERIVTVGETDPEISASSSFCSSQVSGMRDFQPVVANVLAVTRNVCLHSPALIGSALLHADDA